MLKKFYITEAKSINSTVKALSQYIGDSVIRDCGTQEKHISPIIKLPYKTNAFELDVSRFLPKLGILSVQYYMYFIDDMEDYNKIVYSDETETNNSEADYEDKRLRIVSCFYQNAPLFDFQDNIYHEVTHLLQYEEGMSKRVNLYDKTVEIVRSDNQEYHNVGLCSYFSFKHEQDAFVHQFYSSLQSLQYKGDFDSILSSTEYQLFLDTFTELYKNNSKNTDKAIRYLGYDSFSFNKKTRFALRRFKRKLRNAFEKYKLDTRPMMTETFCDAVLESRFSSKLRIEDFYDYK